MVTALEVAKPLIHLQSSASALKNQSVGMILGSEAEAHAKWIIVEPGSSRNLHRTIQYQKVRHTIINDHVCQARSSHDGSEMLSSKSQNVSWCHVTRIEMICERYDYLLTINLSLGLAG